MTRATACCDKCGHESPDLREQYLYHRRLIRPMMTARFLCPRCRTRQLIYNAALLAFVGNLVVATIIAAFLIANGYW